MISNKGLSNSLLIGILIWLTVPVLAQSTRNCEYIRPHQADQWIFGMYQNSGGIDFSTRPAQAVSRSGSLEVSVGVSSYSDASGRLKLYSSGTEVRNGGYNTIANGTGLIGNIASTMNSIFVPNPGNANQVFVFTVDIFYPGLYENGVNYSVIDYSNQGGGEIVSKNNLLFHDNAQKVCAIQHANGTDFWVIFHGYGTNNGDSYYSYLVDTGGVNMNPVISKVGHIQSGFSNEEIANNFGYMKASPDGTKIAATIMYDGIVEILNFDKITGILSNPIQSAPGDISYPYGIEFSPDNSKLYVTTQPLTVNNVPATDILYQFDLESSTPFSQPFTIIDQFSFSTSGSQDSLNGAVQLAPDGRIYLTKFLRGSRDGKPSLSVIYNPNRSGLACNYNTFEGMDKVFDLQGGKSMQGLPTFVTDYLNIPHFSFFNKCENDTTEFEIRNTANLNPTWDFGDPAGNLANNVDPKEPGFVFSTAGKYTVTLTEEWNGESYVVTRDDVFINPLPSVDIGQGGVISILPNSSVRLDAGEYDYYSWFPGNSHDRYLDVNQEGWYKVLVTDTNCCSNIDSVYIQFADLNFPNAFKPSSSLPENQTFGVVGDVASLAKYTLQIYDRWGKIIFETNNPLDKWTGEVKGGDIAPQGVYVWHSVFTTFESGLEASRDIDNRGTVMLVR